MICERCGKEITETYQSSYIHCGRGVCWRSCQAYGKINLWRPDQGKAEKPQVIVLCQNCYEKFVGFLERVE